MYTEQEMSACIQNHLGAHKKNSDQMPNHEREMESETRSNGMANVCHFRPIILTVHEIGLIILITRCISYLYTCNRKRSGA